jgi:membrane protein
MKFFKRLKDRIFQNGLVKFLMRVFSEFGDDGGGTLAAGVAYYVFLSLFPLILGLIGLLGFFLNSAQIQDQLFNFVNSNVPGAKDVLQNNIQAVISLRGTLGIVGVIGLLWSGSGAVAAVANAINIAWDVHKEIQYYWKKLRDIGLTIGLGLLLVISLGLSAAFSFMPVESVPVIGSALVQLGLRVISFLIAWAIFLILFKIIPNSRTYWRDVWFGALVTALLFELGRSLVFYYLTTFSNYKMVYGSIASVIVLLIWIYYTSLIVIIGAELTSEYGRLRRGIGQGVHSHSIANPAKGG